MMSAESGGVQSTSVDALKSFTPRTLSDRQDKVLCTLDVLGKASNKQVAEKLGRPINEVTPRMLELRRFGLVVCAGKRYDDRTRRWELVWELC